MSLVMIDSMGVLNGMISSPKPFLLMVSTTTCPPCKRFTPIVDEVSRMEEFSQIQFGKLNLDELMDANDVVGVGSVPTLIFWKSGREVYREIGASDKNKLISLIKSHLF